eukprot:m.79901 g.79901  ORF g.79901 m.79901 type:complete len:822 (+) comp12582_c1_seq4:132-2597(+)
MAESHGAGYAGGRNRARKYNLANTNIAMLGSDLEKSVRQYAAETEKAWQAVKKREGLNIWRIEQFKVVEVAHDDFGVFYDGDSYIILNKYHRGGTGALKYDIHFWIGSQSSQDEYGTAAYKTVELDDFLGGIAAQYREVQGRESRRFRSLFRNMILMDGGVDSGFHHVKPREYRTRLLHVKGKLNTIALEVPIAIESLNANDSFVLDAGLNVYVWHGKNAGPMEKTKAANLAMALDDNRGGMVAKQIFDQDDRDFPFFTALGVKKGPIKEEAEVQDAAVAIGTKKLVKVAGEGEAVEMTDVASGDEIRRDQLTSDAVFILDDGYEVMVWVGLNAGVAERRAALNAGAEYLKKNGRPMDTPISKIFEGGENEVFEAAFEVGVKSTSNPSDASRSKPASESVMPSYKGSGGPGVVADLDALYAENGVDPEAWGGRATAPSLYAAELESKRLGAYSATAGWVSGMSKRDLELKKQRIAHLEATHSAQKKARASAGGTLLAEMQPVIDFSAEEDAKQYRKAIRWLGTDNNKLIRLMTTRTLEQRLRTIGAYSTLYDRDLRHDIDRDTSGNYRVAATALMCDNPTRRATFLRKSMKGWGTNERVLIDILCTKEADEILKIVEAYTEFFPGQDLEKDIIGETSGDFKRLLVSILQCNRKSLAAKIDPAEVEKDVVDLIEAGEGNWLGTDEAKFISVLSQRSFPHLTEIIDLYERKAGKPLKAALDSELGGDLKAACIAIIDYAADPTRYMCVRMFEAMEGWGTQDLDLIHLIMECAATNLSLVQERFPSIVAELAKDGQPQLLHEMVADETSGNYRKLLLAILGRII